MSSLFLIASEYRDAAAKLADLDLDEQTLTDTLESISGDIEAKARSYGFVVRSLNAEADTWDEWAAQAKKHAVASRARADKVRDTLAAEMQKCGITKISGPGITLSFRASHAVVIDDAEQIPREYMRQKPAPEPEPDKPAIAAAIKLGEAVAGARVETRQTLQVRA